MTADEERAFQGIYRRCYPAVLAYCARRLPVHDAQDVASEVLATAWRRRKVLMSVDAELPWLYGVAARTIANHRRAGRRRDRLTDRVARVGRATGAAAETVVVQRSQDEAMVRTIAQLRSSDREVLMLAGWEGLSASGIAAALDITPAAAEKRLTRAKQRLAARLAHRHGVPPVLTDRKGAS